MTPEQLKLLQKLSQLGKVNLINRSKENIVKAIEKMDLTSLSRLLDEDLTYQDLTKDVFLEKLNELFIELKEYDTHLVANKGFCNSEECSNRGKNGVMFCGNKSGKHFNFVFDQVESGVVNELFHCNKFQCESQNAVYENKKELVLRVYKEDKANFVPSSDYQHKNTFSINAITEIKSTKSLEITKEEIVSWLDKHKEFYESLDWMSFNYKNLSKFYDSYNHISKINDFFNLEEACFIAYKVYVKNDMTNEMQLLKWLVEHDELHCKLMLLHPNIIDKKDQESEKINLFTDLNRYFNLDYLNYCIAVENIFDTYYYEKLNHYRIKYENLKDISPFDDDFDDDFSLGFHLEQRNLFVEKINYIPLLGKNTFLHDSPDFPMMIDRVNFDAQNFRRDNSLNDKSNEDFEML